MLRQNPMALFIEWCNGSWLLQLIMHNIVLPFFMSLTSYRNPLHHRIHRRKNDQPQNRGVNHAAGHRNGDAEHGRAVGRDAPMLIIVIGPMQSIASIVEANSFVLHSRNGFSINSSPTCCPCCKSSVYKRVQPDSSAAATIKAS